MSEQDQTAIVLAHILGLAKRAAEGDQDAARMLLDLVRPDAWYMIVRG